MQQAQQDYTDFLAHQAIREGGDSYQRVGGAAKTAVDRRGSPVICMALLVAYLPLLVGCQGRGGETPNGDDPLSLNRVAQSLDLSVESATNAATAVSEAVAPHAEALRDLTSDELAKLSRWEYRVTDIPRTAPSREVEEQLNRLGSEGWECSVQAHGDAQSRAYCKRRPMGVVQYLKHLRPLM